VIIFFLKIALSSVSLKVNAVALSIKPSSSERLWLEKFEFEISAIVCQDNTLEMAILLSFSDRLVDFRSL
jgi:hypothetical protein